MSKKYEQLAMDIIEKVGGKHNINDVYHCQTRLRFKLVDESIAKTKELEAMEGVAKVIMNAGVYQVVIGTHVKDVFEEIEKLVDIKGKDVVSDEKKSIFSKVIDFVSGTFQPIIPALSGAGMVKAVLALLVVFKLVSTDSQTYYLLNMFADGVFYFLPILLAFTEAQKLKCNPILAAGVAAMMLHPNWGALVAAKDPVYFFEVIPFTLATYTSSVIPILLVVFAQSYVEKFLNRYIPKAVNLVFVPMFTFLIMGTLAFSVLGPIGSIVGGYLATFFNYLATNASWAPALLIGGFLPIMVMFGLHNGVAPLGVMQMADLGFDSIFGPGCVCSNIAQATASAVVAIRTKDKKLRQVAMSGSITAYMGITEPTLYGVNLPKKYPLIAAMIGGACGGLYAGLTQTHRFATGSSGLPAVLLYIGDNTMTCFYNILIALVITFVVTAVVTYALSLKFEKVDTKETPAAPVLDIKKEVVTSPCNGKVHDIKEAKDKVFASEALGKGVMIEPEEGKVIAPLSGTISTLFPSKHAIGIISESGVEVLIHIGIDTVNLNGECFKTHVKQQDQVKAGDLLVEFDMEGIEKAGFSTQTMVVITNTNNYQKIEKTASGSITYNEPLLILEKE
ncbi:MULTISPECIES: beta-glucoside-specific PTS transporter subunit IIABC [Bacillota]|uniref:PTS glucose transporter subunit IIA n=2 Tax=Amedibacillus TaxID=2749846 RepID=A0A7G9GK31_9FIRM|nr:MULTISPECIES: beta-glucoside-specific PTS transporter subunit IIABC [Bacillota]QNM11163.1 PTS glucose transporter subunit IIA [[Eubacterium] hominis]MCH4284786.1 beta-glucoside-specific PTS transporter subunit IIABC [Amedibacillus hominis]RGB52618.1 PTS beta-glucoside transporter subunit EIIBCA [Absiella sp. AM22-9]RGB57091.1 PTS beta-glucoside transporter subunit EIIBCA [Absiella sp. AM10-20]RGB68058.1 PTS beta-glucoside transporter subunit EIIBCA [Absiella sp. AM09-45]